MYHHTQPIQWLLAVILSFSLTSCNVDDGPKVLDDQNLLLGHQVSNVSLVDGTMKIAKILAQEKPETEFPIAIQVKFNVGFNLLRQSILNNIPRSQRADYKIDMEVDEFIVMEDQLGMKVNKFGYFLGIMATEKRNDQRVFLRTQLAKEGEFFSLVNREDNFTQFYMCKDQDDDYSANVTSVGHVELGCYSTVNPTQRVPGMQTSIGQAH